MARFRFRLQQILEYRELEEQWARDAYLAARDLRAQKEVEIAAIDSQRSVALGQTVVTVAHHRELEQHLECLDDKQRQLGLMLQVLEQDELRAQETWLDRRRDKQLLEKLREKELEAWRKEQDRLEQVQLDEFATMRRAA